MIDLFHVMLYSLGTLLTYSVMRITARVHFALHQKTVLGCKQDRWGPYDQFKVGDYSEYLFVKIFIYPLVWPLVPFWMILAAAATTLYNGLNTGGDAIVAGFIKINSLTTEEDKEKTT